MATQRFLSVWLKRVSWTIQKVPHGDPYSGHLSMGLVTPGMLLVRSRMPKSSKTKQNLQGPHEKNSLTRTTTSRSTQQPPEFVKFDSLLVFHLQ